MTLLKRTWKIFLFAVWLLAFFGAPPPRDWVSTQKWLALGDGWLQHHVAYPGIFLLLTGLLIGTVIAPQLFSIVRDKIIRPAVKPDIRINEVLDYIVNESQEVLQRPAPPRLMEYGPAKGRCLIEVGVEHQDALNKVNEMLAASKLVCWGRRSLEISIVNQYENYRREIPGVQWEKIRLHPLTCLYWTETESQTGVLPNAKETYNWTALMASRAQVQQLWPRKSPYRRFIATLSRAPRISPRPGWNLND
jgi:hypothetical protein